MPRKVDSLSKHRSSPSTGLATPASQTVADTYENLFPEPGVVIEGPPRWIWWLLFVAAALLLAYVGMRGINGSLRTWLSLEEPTATAPSPNLIIPSVKPSSIPSDVPSAPPQSKTTPTPTLTPAPTPDKTPIKIRVLNGTTTNGAAAAAKVILEKAGFRVRTIGNARNQTYRSTIIYYLSGKTAEAELVKTALPDYSASLEESAIASPDEVVVVIGST